MNSKLLIFGSKNFNNSIMEVKEYLNFSLIFFDFSNKLDIIDPSISALIVEAHFLDNGKFTIIDKFKDKPILLIQNKGIRKKYNYNDKILLPVSLIDLKNKIKNFIISFEYSLNSSLKIKKYLLNKNEKKLFNGNSFISITEREVQLIELLFIEKKPLTKNYILKKIWNYSDNADTHTVETHIYRLRKKIYNKFNDNKFILNIDKGYII
jgi:hypothetical protein